MADDIVDRCPLCQALTAVHAVAKNRLAAAIADAHPVSPGHVLVVSRRHVASLLDLTAEEHQALWELIPTVAQVLGTRLAAHGYNIGVNVGAAAGQTILHVHVHVIPRFEGDVVDPRGGIRWVIPDRADYWSKRR